MYDESKGRGGDAGADEARVTAEGDAGPAKPPEPRSEEAARQEELARIAPAALDAALVALAAPAFVVRAPGTVLRANARGAALLATEPARVLAALRDGTAHGPLAPVRYDVQGATHFVAVLPDIEDQAARRALGAHAPADGGAGPRRRGRHQPLHRAAARVLGEDHRAARLRAAREDPVREPLAAGGGVLDGPVGAPRPRPGRAGVALLRPAPRARPHEPPRPR